MEPKIEKACWETIHSKLAQANKQNAFLEASLKIMNTQLEAAVAEFESTAGAGQAYITIPSSNLYRMAALLRGIKAPI